MFNRLRGISVLWLLLLLLPAPVSAQTAASATLSSPLIEAFPRVEAFLDVRDEQGNFHHGLQAADVRLLEDERPLSVLEIKELRPGAQFVIALNPGPAFAVRNSRGVSRYDFIAEALRSWAKSRRGTTIDDWSLLIPDHPEITHVRDSIDWVSGILTDTVDVRNAVPSLDTVFRAVEIAADPSRRQGMGRGVLFITPTLSGDLALPLENLAARANQQRVSIFVWLISPAGAPLDQAGKSLTNLAQQTGGQFFNYSGEEGIPNPEDYLDPLRSVYHVAYESKIKTSGAHQLAAEILTGTEQVRTPAQSFEVSVEPPDPAFISPVLKIRRIAASPENQDDPGEVSLDNLTPTKQNLQVLVDFPDGRIRPMVRTTLFVDGVAVATNTQPPYDQFTWDLSMYTTSGSHLLRVEAEDSLGLVGSSIETMVQIEVAHPTRSALAALYRHKPVLAGLATLLAGAVLLLVLVLGGRIQPRTTSEPKRHRRKSDPVTQPVPVKNEPASRRRPNWVNRLQWPQRRIAPKAFAFLTRISETDTAATATPVPITAEEITLGSDPNLATLVLNDPSVDGLHARLVRKDDNSFRLADEGSIAGTWINYTPISRDGVRLEHGDLIHIGRVGFRFTLRQVGQSRRPVITLQEHKT